MTNNFSMIDLLRYVYIESRRETALKGVSGIDPKDEATFRVERDNLNPQQQWLLHKYIHSIRVLEAGVDIILGEEKLKNQPEHIKKDWYNALLMHDVGRAYERSREGKNILRYPHGTLGMEMLERCGITSPHVLFPVLMHDRMNFDIFSLKPEDVMTDPHFKEDKKYKDVPIKIKETIKNLLEQYHRMNPKEQEAIRLGCKMVVDADQLANLKEFDKMLNLSNLPMIPAVSEPVEQAIKEQHYVNYKDLKTYPDEAVAYMAWMFYGNYPAYRSELIKNDLLTTIRQFVVKKIKQNESPENVEKLDKKLEGLQSIIEKNLKSKMNPVNRTRDKNIANQRAKIVANVLKQRVKE